MSTEVRVPTLGESVSEATVATWFKKPGDAVDADEMLCELETDKVTVEVPSPTGGTLGEIVAQEGETVGVDALLATLAEGDAKPAPASEESKPEAPAPKDGGSDAGESLDVMVPTLGESVSEATVSTWFKAVGDSCRGRRDAVRARDRQGLGRGAEPRRRHADRDPRGRGRHRAGRRQARADGLGRRGPGRGPREIRRGPRSTRSRARPGQIA